MTSRELERLAERRLLDQEPSSTEEIDGLITSGQHRLADAMSSSNSIESRFTLADDAAHAFALAALRRAGFRSKSRYLVFQCLDHTVAVPAATRRQLATAHERRNKGQYEGVFDLSERFVQETIAAAQAVLAALRAASG